MFKPWERFQIEIGGRWQLFPAEITWKEWAFDPYFGITFPGQLISSRVQVPDFYKCTRSEPGPELKAYSRVFWFRIGARILGLDFGLAVLIITGPRGKEQ